MKHVLIWICLACASSFGQAQNFRCAFSGPTVKPIVAEAQTDAEGDLEDLVDAVIEEILGDLGLNSLNFWAQPASNVRNFQAEYNESEESFEVYYSFTFLKNLRSSLNGSRWETIFAVYVISAHELGHHLNGDVHGSGGDPDQELYADYFAGKTAARHGIPYASAVRVYELCAAVGATTTHPGRADRVEAFKEGYDNGK
jgi:hypothetical protein